MEKRNDSSCQKHFETKREKYWKRTAIILFIALLILLFDSIITVNKANNLVEQSEEIIYDLQEIIQQKSNVIKTRNERIYDLEKQLELNKKSENPGILRFRQRLEKGKEYVGKIRYPYKMLS